MLRTGTPHDWTVPFAATLGIRSLDEPMFRETVGSTDPIAQIDHVAGMGLAGIADNMLRLRPPAVQARMGRALAEHGLRFGSFVVSPPPLQRLAWGQGGQEATELIRAEVLACAEAAERVRAEALTVTSVMLDDCPVADQLTLMSDRLAGLVSEIRSAGLRLCVESVSAKRVSGMLLNHIHAADEVARTAGPEIGLIFDTHHVAAMDGDVLEALHKVSERVAILQIADFPERAEPGTGTLDFAKILAAFARLRPGALVECEFFPRGSGRAGEEAALEALRRADTAAARAGGHEITMGGNLK
ncbi:TIM barrel protein [Tropicimonas isoalkanivorans]|uniref:Hydroxypyruvate isomerase n=1 Tax=Tropicimonas isoalkanivorans TaxID=441112 RepID=A0A1I1HXR8_9RHOB|nr:TIM barrel protein [Tropicimonas isoalkanivorans]SFC28631.1 hydroxypyruvate isomerase [Tropicimonas isoalkanivorans]